MVGCDHVAQNGQNLGIFDVFDRARILGHAFEIRWVLHVSGRCRPVVSFRVSDFNSLPFFVALKYVCVFLQERFTGYCFFDQFVDFRGCWPDVFQVDIIAVTVLADWVGREVDVHRASQRVGHDQWWGREVVRAHVW